MRPLLAQEAGAQNERHQLDGPAGRRGDGIVERKTRHRHRADLHGVGVRVAGRKGAKDIKREAAG